VPDLRRLVVATGNRHKLAELHELLPGIPLVGLDAFPPAPEPVEDAPDFEGNAIIKAHAARERTGLPSLADDSGIEVAALSWGPGVHSARYVPGSDRDRRLALLRAVGDATDRRARFTCLIAVAGLPDDLVLPPGLWRREGCVLARGVVEGEIGFEERGEHGFGYDPIFELPDRGRLTTAELPPDEKNAISHRGRAARAVFPLLRTVFST
jgi:XTP/dITP diphosphohydrolase